MNSPVLHVLDKVRSFAQAREADVAVVRSGLTYGDCRVVMTLVERLQLDLKAAETRARAAERHLRWLGVLEQ